MKVAILLGSIRLGRQSHKAAYLLEKTLKNRGIETDLIDLLKEPLPLLEERAGYHSDHPDVVSDIGNRLQNADAIVLVTPEYHGSFSGALKNALDYFRSEFLRKPVGVATASSGRLGGVGASTQLQHVILSMGAYPLPVKWLVPEIHRVIDDAFEARDERAIKSLNKFLDEFLWFAGALLQKKPQARVA